MFFLVFDTGLGLQVISAYIKMLLINPVLPHKYFSLRWHLRSACIVWEVPGVFVT